MSRGGQAVCAPCERLSKTAVTLQHYPCVPPGWWLPVWGPVGHLGLGFALFYRVPAPWDF